MVEEFDATPGKSAGDLTREAFWFLAHTLIAVALLLVVVLVFYAMRIDPDAVNPKIVGTILALLVPMIGGYVIARVRHDNTARYVWISGLLTFSIVCVWVLDLPTGNGLCDKCGAVAKLYRTFFDITNGSGLMGGDGWLVGTCIPLSMIGYSIGARFGLDS